jgi:hypothetical protein
VLLRAGEGGDFAEAFEERLEGERLLENRDGAEAGEAIEDVFFAEAVHDEDAGAGVERADFAEDFGAVEAGHGEVEEDGGEALRGGAEVADGFVAVGGEDGFIAVSAELVVEGFEDGGFVVCDEDGTE